MGLSTDWEMTSGNNMKNVFKIRAGRRAGPYFAYNEQTKNITFDCVVAQNLQFIYFSIVFFVHLCYSLVSTKNMEL